MRGRVFTTAQHSVRFVRLRRPARRDGNGAQNHQRLLVTGYDGVRRTIDATAYPLLNESGENDGILAVFWQEIQSDSAD